MADIISLFGGPDPLNDDQTILAPDAVLEGAKGLLERVLVIGLTKEGTLYGAASYPDMPLMLWDMEHIRKVLLEVNDE